MINLRSAATSGGVAASETRIRELAAQLNEAKLCAPCSPQSLYTSLLHLSWHLLLHAVRHTGRSAVQAPHMLRAGRRPLPAMVPLCGLYDHRRHPASFVTRAAALVTTLSSALPAESDTTVIWP